MKNKILLLSIIALMSADYAKSQCTTPVNNSGTTGTQYYLPRYSQTGVPCLQNSSIWDNGNVGIGVTSPSYKLEVSGQIYASSYVTTAGILGISGQGCAFAQSSNCMFGAEWSGTISNGGAYNAFVGVASGNQNTSGSNNTFSGYGAATSNSTGSNNTISGYSAGWGVFGNSFSNNSFFGYEAGYGTTTGGNNVFMGYQAGLSNSSAINNVFVGFQAGLTNTTGTKNSFFGNYAGYNHNANFCSFFGYGSGFTNSSGADNTFLGYAAGYSNTTGAENTFVGLQAGFSSTTSTGGLNTFVGLNAGYANTTGGHNTALGNYAGDSYSTETYSTYVGYSADANANSYTNSSAFGNAALITGNNDIVLGNASITTLRCNAALTGLSDGRVKDNIQSNVPGLTFINLLKPVTFHYNVDRENKILGVSNPVNDSSGAAATIQDMPGKYDVEQIQYSGFIAQSVDSAAQKVGYDFSGVYKPKDESKDLWGLSYSSFIPSMVSAIQELSKTVDSLQSKIAVLEKISSTQSADNNQSLPSQSVTLTSQKAILYQNNPNPAGDQTSIGYYLADGTISAQMVFFDMYGKEIKRVDLENRGNAKLDVNTKDLQSGIYSYSLIVDGNVIDTLKMAKAK